MKIYVIDFSGSGKITRKLQNGNNFQVYSEYKDGGKAYKEVGDLLPDLILINMAAKSSHGLQTAEAIKKRKKTNHIPILFVNTEENKKFQHLGRSILFNEIADRILIKRFQTNT